MRQLVRIDSIDDIRPIPDADAIETAVVGGWTVVVKKGEFSPGDEAIYVEIDAALPLTDSRFDFLAARGVRIIDGVARSVIKTARLRGQISQGILFPLDLFRAEVESADGDPERLREALDIIKWEPPIPAELSGQIRGGFPSHIIKTDAERVQNLSAEFEEFPRDGWTATEKIDGTSVTLINDPEGIRVCSRNWELVPREEMSQVIWATENRFTENIPAGWAVQGELVGPGIQKNLLKLKRPELFIFSVIDDRGRSVGRSQWPEWALDRAVPILDLPFPGSVSEAVDQSDKLQSLITPGVQAEGIVWHHETVIPSLGRACWKSINPSWLVKQAKRDSRSGGN